MNTEHDWLVWWHDEGSGMRPVNGKDHESHVRDMTRIAWLNGAFGAADEIERLRAERNHAVAALSEQISTLIRERDEAKHGESVATATLQGVIEERTALRAVRDRKNLTIQALTEERDEVVRMANKLTAERDEARREACESCSETIGGAMLEAEERGWDCFKEDTND